MTLMHGEPSLNDMHVDVDAGYRAYKQYMPDAPTMAHLARQTLAVVLAGGRGSRLRAADRLAREACRALWRKIPHH